MNENPVRAIRRKLGLSKGDMALLIGSSFSALTRVELGYAEQIPPQVLNGIACCGYNAQELQAQYIEWRKRRGLDLAAAHAAAS